MDFLKVTLVGLLSITIIQCSSKARKEAEAKSASTEIAAPATTPVVQSPPTPPTEANPAHTDEKSAVSTKELEDLKVSLKNAEAVAKKDSPAQEPHADHHRKVNSTSAEKALSWLKNGNARFTKGHLRKDGAAKKDIERLATGQAPHSIILSCSDSRVPPEVIFDQKLGEIFVIRTAGESLDNAVIASMEYAVEHLGTNLILVMGHSSCGAVKASFETAVGGDTGSPYINALVAEIQPRIAERMKGPASASFVAEGWDNARGVAQKLLEKSKVIREAAKSGSLRVETALYHLKSGQVEWNH